VLYVVFDDIGRCLVSRDEPLFDRRVERADYDGIVGVALSGAAGDWARSSPDLAATRMLTGSVLAVVAGATIGASVLLTPLVGLPAGVVAAIYVGRRHNAAATRLEQRWADRHRILATRAELLRFRRAFDAARTVLVAWPALADLVQVASPRREVAASLWSIAGLLRDHADLAEQFANLTDARFGALPAEAPVRNALDDRLARVEASQRAISAEIDRRLASLSKLARRCAEFVRAERAMHIAYEAVRRADESLGHVVPPQAAAPDETRELDERTAAILQAYRELRQA
jgi:hypothetical protein